MVSAQSSPPSEIIIVYRGVGKTHVFTSPELRGFHIGSASLKTVFDTAPDALSKHVSLLFGSDVHYHLDMSFKEFEASLDSSEPMLPGLLIAYIKGAYHRNDAAA